MARVVIPDQFLERLSELDVSIRRLNEAKIKLLFEALGMGLSDNDFALIKEWELIVVSVADKQMAVQLNRLSSYIPNLLFRAEPEKELFSLSQGVKGRRVWKER